MVDVNIGTLFVCSAPSFSLPIPHHSQGHTLRNMWSVASLWLTQCMLVVHAMPLASAAAVQQSGTREVSKGETPRDRTIYIGVCLLCLLVSSTLLGKQ